MEIDPFCMADVNGHEVLDLEEASDAMLDMESSMPLGCGELPVERVEHCSTAITSKISMKYPKVSGWQAIAHSFAPCVLRGQPGQCQSEVCVDV
jgi:hypothetical protein